MGRLYDSTWYIATQTWIPRTEKNIMNKHVSRCFPSGSSSGFCEHHSAKTNEKTEFGRGWRLRNLKTFGSVLMTNQKKVSPGQLPRLKLFSRINVLQVVISVLLLFSLLWLQRQPICTFTRKTWFLILVRLASIKTEIIFWGLVHVAIPGATSVLFVAVQRDFILADERQN